MRIVLTFTEEKGRDIILEFSYNKLIQGFIYSNLNENLAEKLHEEGFNIGNRSFKLFTFSRILAKHKMINNSFHIRSPFKIVISSINEEFVQDLSLNLIRKKSLKLGDNNIVLEGLEIKKTLKLESTDKLKIKMLSPITIYSTLLTKEGKKKTYYYNPYENEFSDLIKNNLIRKHIAFYNREPIANEFSITPISVRKDDEIIIKYDGFVIKGWLGVYEIRGNEDLVKIAYYCGIGSKNSQGFGCFDII
ncbi:MAG: CRISPR-associated endoribonuclease Cas6 [Elusimicrobiales bacterium]|nr:CRISPR-associated endoribonuclease Cas6 [Elusimicrobiales bacterium]